MAWCLVSTCFISESVQWSLIERGVRDLHWELLAMFNTCTHRCNVTLFYEGVSKSFRTGHLERELQMVELSATRCSCIATSWVSLVSFAAITLCVASQRVIPKDISLSTQSGNFWIHPRTWTLNQTVFFFSQNCLIVQKIDTRHSIQILVGFTVFVWNIFRYSLINDILLTDWLTD
jgi:hypothetical protein